MLTPDNFDGFIASQEYTIVEFFAPWCGHCKSLAPEWEAAAKKTRKLDPPTILAKVDADAHKDLASRYDITGYPTIKIFKGGKASEYEGPREAKGIVKYVKSELGITGAGSLTKLTAADEAERLTADTGYALIGHFREPTKASAIFAIFSEVASELPSITKKSMKAAYSASYGNDPIAAALGYKTVPAIVLYRPGEEPLPMPIPRKRTDFTEESLVEFIQAHVDSRH